MVSKILLGYKSGSVEEWWRRWPCIPRVSGSSPSAGDFSLQPSGSPAVILVHNQCQHLSLCKDSMLCGISMRRQRENPINRHLLWPMIVIYHTSTHTSKHHPAPSIGTKSPRSTVNMVTWTNWICDERNSVEGAAVWACTHTHTLYTTTLTLTKNTTQRHLMSSKGTQQVSIGSTEVHIVAASNYHHKCW